MSNHTNLVEDDLSRTIIPDQAMKQSHQDSSEHSLSSLGTSVPLESNDDSYTRRYLVPTKQNNFRRIY